MLCGYARVSSTDQDLSLQEAALKSFGCMRIWSEKKSGTSREERAELALLLGFVRAGDVVVVTRLDRLARSSRDLFNLVNELEQKGIALKVTEQPIDTSSAAGKAFLGMLAIFAEFETNLRKERQLEGIKKAKEKGIYKGRKPSRFYEEEILQLHSEGHKPGNIQRLVRCSRSTVYRVLERAGIKL